MSMCGRTPSSSEAASCTAGLIVPPSTIAPLQPSDSAEALQLSYAAGWNQTEGDWRRVITLEPQGCWGIRCDGRLVSTASTICYGRELAWIGMVLTDARYRRRGFARALITRCLEYLEQREVQTVRLDATDFGSVLYKALGFCDEHAVERWTRAPGPVPPSPVDPGPFRVDTALDRAAFGADRTRLLDLLARLESASSPDGGYAMGRPGARGSYFGPCVSRLPQTARALLAWYLNRHREETVFWDLVPRNPNALALAGEFGFEKQRTLTRMVRPMKGPAVDYPELSGNVYALAGFEFG
jgi:GNAT superfamily N-acetyltransferase